MRSIVLICGPPGSGKTTWVMERLIWGELVVDIDKLFRAISGQPSHNHPENLLPYVLRAREAIFDQLLIDQDEGRAWVIMGGATRESRRVILDQFDDAELHIIHTDPLECERNIRADPQRSHAPIETWMELVRKWFDEYEPE